MLSKSKPSTPNLMRIPEEGFELNNLYEYKKQVEERLDINKVRASGRDYLANINFTEENEQDDVELCTMGYKFCAKHPKKLVRT